MKPSREKFRRLVWGFFVNPESRTVIFPATTLPSGMPVASTSLAKIHSVQQRNLIGSCELPGIDLASNQE